MKACYDLKFVKYAFVQCYMIDTYNPFLNVKVTVYIWINKYDCVVVSKYNGKQLWWTSTSWVTIIEMAFVGIHDRYISSMLLEWIKWVKINRLESYENNSILLNQTSLYCCHDLFIGRKNVIIFIKKKLRFFISRKQVSFLFNNWKYTQSTYTVL